MMREERGVLGLGKKRPLACMECQLFRGAHRMKGEWHPAMNLAPMHGESLRLPRKTNDAGRERGFSGCEKGPWRSCKLLVSTKE